MHLDLEDCIVYREKENLLDMIATLDRFDPISLDEMDSVALLKRTDTKFIVNEKNLFKVLDSIHNDYRVLEIAGDRLMSYNSLYFDTENKKLYNDHHNGRVKRLKVRVREYVESARCYLEIKQKDSKGDTHKSRIRIPTFETELSESSKQFIKETIKTDIDLVPVIRTTFNRFTLVSKTRPERVTIDLKLHFNIKDSVEYDGKDLEKPPYEGLGIVEVKQERFDRTSKIVCALKKHSVNPYSISKYCIGMLCHYNYLKRNTFKHKILKIKKVGA